MRTLDQVREHRDVILRLAAKYGIRRVRLFGSVARGEAKHESDVDVLVDFEPGRSLLDQVGFEQELEAFVRRGLADPSFAEDLGRRAQSLVIEQQGAADRTIQLLDQRVIDAQAFHVRRLANTFDIAPENDQ